MTKETNQKSNSVAKTRQKFLVEKLAEQLSINYIIPRSKFNGMTIFFGNRSNGTITVGVCLDEQKADPSGTFISGTARQLSDAIKLGFTVHEPPIPTNGSTDQK